MLDVPTFSCMIHELIKAKRVGNVSRLERRLPQTHGMHSRAVS